MRIIVCDAGPIIHLKELNMTEGRGTGIPKILRAMKANGSPDPRFETDDDRTYFVSYFPAHSLIVSKETAQAGTKSGPSRDQVGTKFNSLNLHLKNDQ